MKYLSLVWRYLMRKKFRTILTLLSIMVSLVLYALLMTIVTAFSMGIEIAGVDRLMMMHKVSLLQLLPISYQQEVQSTKGVELVTHNTWFGGSYQDKPLQFGIISIEPDVFFKVYPEYKVAPADFERFRQDRQGVIVGRDTATLYNWKVGDRVPIAGDIWRPKQGDTWFFNISGIYDGEKTVDKTGFFFHYDYLDENRSGGQGMVGWFVMKINDPPNAANIAAAVDAKFANSPAETKTSTEKAWIQGFVNQIGDVKAIMIAILIAVFFTLFLLVTANTMAQNVRERAGEFAVLKTLGFPNGLILSLVLSETLFLALLGGGLGLLLSWLLISSGNMNNVMLPVFTLTPRDLTIGLVLCMVLGAVSGAIPSINAMRLKIVDALRRN